jgi:peptidoglycan/LPS O-acetylase OafA/YrhL
MIARVDPGPGRHVPALDGLRGLAILLVVLHHAYPTARTSAGARLIAAVVEAGWVGVHLFFVLSGFLITGILLDARGDRAYYRHFYPRRFLRIAPLYYAFLAANHLVAPWAARRMPAGPDSPRFATWPIWTFLTNMPEVVPVGPLVGALGPLWSLAVEEQVYLVWPLLVATLPRRGLIGLFAAMVPASLGWRLGVLAGLLRPEVAYTWMPSALDAFAAGGLVAALVREPGLRNGLRTWATRVAGGSVLVVAGIAIGLGHFHAWQAPAAILGPGASALALGFAAVITRIVTAGPGSNLVRVLSCRPLRALGRRSYAMYLLHMPVFYVLRPFVTAHLGRAIVAWSTPTSVLVFLAILGATYLAAALSWAVLEGPCNGLKRFFPLPSTSLATLPATSPSHDSTRPEGHATSSRSTRRASPRPKESRRSDAAR